MYAVVRRNGNNEYRVKLRFAANGNVFVSASTVVNNVETPIGSEALVPGLTHTANAIIRFRAQVSGSSPTTLRVRAWADGTTEPTTWHYTQTNSNAALQSAGLLGLRTYISSSITNSPLVFDLRRLPRHLASADPTSHRSSAPTSAIAPTPRAPSSASTPTPPIPMARR